MKTFASNKVDREHFKPFITSLLPVKHMTGRDGRLDALGGVLIISLAVALMFWMRLILAN
jgi:hypothetical protein